MFRINEVLMYEGSKYRILDVFPDTVIWISIDDKKAFPSLIGLNELQLAIDDGFLQRDSDPFSHLALQSPEEGTIAREKRDKNHKLIKSLIDSNEYYIPKSRSAIINKIIAEQGSTKQTLYRLARQYWQRGQTVNTLIPDYKNSGAQGNKRIAKKVKLGRPRVHMPGTGVNVDELIERLFRIAIDKYLLTDKGYSFPYAHRRFKDTYETYFPDVLEEEIPTNWQMNHFYKREYSQVEKIKKRNNNIAFNKDIKPLHSTVIPIPLINWSN